MLAFAVTIHKVQRCTLDRIAILCDDKYFASGQMYIAISRVRELCHLQLVDFDHETFRANTKIDAFYADLLEYICNHNELSVDATHSLPFPCPPTCNKCPTAPNQPGYEEDNDADGADADMLEDKRPKHNRQHDPQDIRIGRGLQRVCKAGASPAYHYSRSHC